jgi:phosphoribosylaminoimidazole carboxylase (NCAIR synthetase)
MKSRSSTTVGQLRVGKSAHQQNYSLEGQVSIGESARSVHNAGMVLEPTCRTVKFKTEVRVLLSSSYDKALLFYSTIFKHTNVLG